jgi:hypothetical protein
VDRSHLLQDRVQWQALVNTAITIWFHKSRGISWRAGRLSAFWWRSWRRAVSRPKLLIHYRSMLIEEGAIQVCVMWWWTWLWMPWSAFLSYSIFVSSNFRFFSYDIWYSPLSNPRITWAHTSHSLHPVITDTLPVSVTGFRRDDRRLFGSAVARIVTWWELHQSASLTQSILDTRFVWRLSQLYFCETVVFSDNYLLCF